jgi:hypothetical protein
MNIWAIAYANAMEAIGDRIWRTVGAIQLKFGTRVQLDMLYDCDEFRCDNSTD